MSDDDLIAAYRGRLDLARLPGSYTCQDDAHVTPPHIDICVLPFLPPTCD
jgi:hypothetical protein